MLALFAAFSVLVDQLIQGSAPGPENAPMRVKFLLSTRDPHIPALAPFAASKQPCEIPTQPHLRLQQTRSIMQSWVQR